MSKKTASSVVRQSSRIEATESVKVLDDAARLRRQRKALLNLEQDNFHEDPHAHLQWHKKRPKFEDHDMPSAGTSHSGGRKKLAKEERLDPAQIKKRKLMRSDHFKQRFRKNFALLLEEENTNKSGEGGEYDKASAPPPLRPPRKLCAVCGFFSKYTCIRCGTRYCCIRCRDVHNETRYTINQAIESHNVVYLGNVLTVLARGEDCVEKPLALIWKAYQGRKKADLQMRLEVTNSGLKAETKAQGLTEYFAHRITFSSAPANYPRLFCWVYKHEGKRLRPELRCHAVLVKKKSEASELHDALSSSLHNALQEYRREKLSQQKSRTSSLTGTCPRRKLLLQTGSLHFRPPVSRSRSAPRLGSIDEELEEEEEESSDIDSVCYREEPIGDAVSTSSSSYSPSDGTITPAHSSSPSSSSFPTSYSQPILSSVSHHDPFYRSISNEPDSVSEESGYGEEKEEGLRRGRLIHSDSLMYSDEELIILEEELDDLTVTPL